MTKPLVFFDSSKFQRVPISKEKSSVLLDRKVKIFFIQKNGSKGFIEGSIFEIFTRCQVSLAAKFQLNKFSLKGSSVAHIFSNEPFADIDIHGFIDLSTCTPPSVIKRGHEIKWCVLDSILHIVNEKLSIASSDLEPVKSLEQIIFEDQLVSLGSREVLPFNIHTLRLGSPPIEFTFFALIHEDFAAQRFFDFNCGALELQIDSHNDISLLSPLNMSEVLDEISRRELRCESPSKLLRKSIYRYLSKVSISGYHDKDLALLSSFIANLKERKGSFVDDDSMIQEVMKEIIDNFKSKGLHPAVGLLNLYFYHAETELLEMLRGQAIGYLTLHLEDLDNPHLKVINTLIIENKLSECAWYFLCLAKKINYVSHRSKECLQVEIPLAKLFEKIEDKDKAFYINLPLVELWKLKQVDYSAYFLRLLNEDIYFESYSEKAQIFMNSMLAHVLVKNRLGQVLSVILNRLKIKANKSSSQIFLQQLSFFRQTMEGRLPFFVVQQAFEHADALSIATPKVALEIIKQVSSNLAANEVFAFESSLKFPLIMHSLLMILKENFLESIDVQEKERYLHFVKNYTADLIDRIDGGHFEDLSKLKIIINISYHLYQKGDIPVDYALKGCHLCLKYGLIPQGVIYLKNILPKVSSITKGSLEHCLRSLIEGSLQEFQQFCFNNKVLLKERLGAYSFELFFEKLASSNVIDPHLGSLKEFYIFFLSQKEKEAFNIKVFQNAVQEQLFYQKLYKAFSDLNLITLDELKHISSPSVQELRFVFMQDSYNQIILKDESFASFYIEQCFNRDLYPEVFFSIQVLLKDSCHDRQKLFLFLSLLALKPNYFIEVFQFFTSLSIDSLDLSEQHYILNNMLRTLDAAIDSDDKGASFLLNEDAATVIASFHKMYVRKTLKNSCWQKLWGKLSINRKNCLAANWIDFEKFEYIILNLNPSGTLRVFLLAFIHDYSFVCQYINKVSLFDPAIQGLHNAIICDLLTNKSYAIFSNILFENQENIQASAHVLNIALSLIHSKSLYRVSEDDVVRFMYLFLFAVAFGDREIRNQVLKILTSLIIDEDSPLPSIIHSTGLLEEIFITAADVLIKENNLQDIKALSESFKQVFLSIGDDGESYSKTNFSQVLKVKEILVERGQLWHKFLKKIFSKQYCMDTIDLDDPAFIALDFYTRYLIQVVISIFHALRVSESVQSLSAEREYLREIHTIHLNSIFTLLETLSGKKFIKSSHAILHVLCLIGYLDEEDMRLLTAKFTSYVISQIKFMDIESQKEEFVKDGFALLKYVSMLLAHIELKFGSYKGNQQLMALLEAARSKLPCYINKTHFIDSDFLNAFSFIEGCLKPQEAIGYYDSWINSMLLRAGNITYSEINLFTIFTFRCDSRFSQSIANGHNFKRYENKYFINKGFFKSASRIKDLISLFDLAFRRFYHHLENDLADPMMMNLDIFSFFGVFSAHLKEGIDSLKNRAEAGKLQMQFIEVLSNAIEMPVSRVTLYVLQGLWGYLLMIDDQGIFSFKNKSKEQIIKSIMVFYRLIERLKRLPDSFLSQHDVPFEQLIMTYDHHKSAFEKNLSKSQNVSIIEFLTLKTTESFMNFSGPKNAAGGLGDVSFLDDSLFKEMQEDLFSQSTIAVTDLYSEVSGK